MSHPQDDEQQSGSVSEVDNLGDGAPIDPDQSVAAAPEDDDVQEGRQGPNARTGNESRDERD